MDCYISYQGIPRTFTRRMMRYWCFILMNTLQCLLLHILVRFFNCISFLQIFFAVRPSSFFSPFSVIWSTQICGIFKKKKSYDVVKPFFTWNNSFNLKHQHSNSIEKNRNKNRNIFYSILCILLIQICECYHLMSSWGTRAWYSETCVVFF